MKLKFGNKYRELSLETIKDKFLIKGKVGSPRNIIVKDNSDEEKEPIHDIHIVIKGEDIEKGVNDCVYRYAKMFGAEEGLHIISLNIKAFDLLTIKDHDNMQKLFDMHLIQHNREDRYDIYELMNTRLLPIPKGDVWIARIDIGTDIPLISVHSFVTKSIELMREDYMFMYRYIPDYAVNQYNDQMSCYSELRRNEKNNGKEKQK